MLSSGSSMVNSAIRREPQQQRSQRRIDAILDATEAELLAPGIGAVTTNGIAARAGTSVGSLYQYFPNKEAVLAALGQRYIECMRLALAVVRAPEAVNLTVAEWVNLAIDALAQVHVTSPGFDAFFCDPGFFPDLADAEAALKRQTFQGAVEALSARTPDLPLEQVQRYAMVAISLVQAMLPLAKSSKDPGPVLADLKGLLRAYLEPVFDRPASAQ